VLDNGAYLPDFKKNPEFTQWGEHPIAGTDVKVSNNNAKILAQGGATWLILRKARPSYYGVNTPYPAPEVKPYHRPL
jgi:hypothetical protein